MIYYCENCGFLFQRNGEVSNCPNCDNRNIRPATKQEEEKLLQLLDKKGTNQP